MLDQDKNSYLISLSILITCLLDAYGCYREKLHVDHLWEMKGEGPTQVFTGYIQHELHGLKFSM